MNKTLLLTGLLAAGALAGATALAQVPGEAERAAAEAERAGAEAAAAQAARTEAELERARRQLEAARAELEEAARVIAVRAVPAAADRGRYIVSTQGAAAGGGSGAGLGALITDAGDGALVTRVLPGSGAAEAGLEVGDIILSIDGAALVNGDGDGNGDSSPYARLIGQLDGIEPGASVRLGVERGGETLELDVATTDEPVAFFRDFASGDFNIDVRRGEIGNLPRVAASIRNLAVPAPVPNVEIVRTLGFASSAWGDMELVEMTAGLARYFETSAGLLVVRSPGDESIGIEDGDVILSISGREPNSPAHALRILGSFEPGETVEFELMRDGRRETVAHVVPASGPANVTVRGPAD